MKGLFLILFLISYSQIGVGGQTNISDLISPKKIVFNVVSFFDFDISTKVKRSDIKKVNYFHQLCDDYPYMKIDSITSIGISILTKTERVLIESPTNEISDKQRTAIGALDYFDKFYFIVEFVSRYNIKAAFGEEFVVMPEKEAAFSNEMQNLIQYFEKKSEGKIDIKKWRKNDNFAANFSVSEDGKIIDIKNTNKLNNKYLNTYFITLLSEMPLWNPAIGYDGEPIKQSGFRLIVTLEDI